MAEFSLVSSIVSLLRRPKTERQGGGSVSLQSIIQEELQKSPAHRREGRPLTEEDIQETASLLPQERQKMRDVYLKDFSQEYWAARVVQSVLAIKAYENNNPNSTDPRDSRVKSRLPHHLMAELRNSAMGFYLREFMIRSERPPSGSQLSSTVKDALLMSATRELFSVVHQLWQAFRIETPVNLSLEGNDSHLVIFKQELSAMMDIYDALESVQGVTGVIVQPATGTEDARGKVDCYVLVKYGNRGYQQYAVQIKRRHYHRYEGETEDRYKLAGTNIEVDRSQLISGLYRKEKGKTIWYCRRRNPDGTLGDEKVVSSNGFRQILQVLTGEADSNHGIDSPYFILPQGVNPDYDVQYYTAFWLIFSPSGGTNRR